MTALLKAEYLKNRRRYIFLTELALTAAAGAWAFYGSYTGESGSFALENGYMLYLYQLPLINTIFFPLMCTLIASRLAETEHSGGGFRRLCVIAERGRVYDAKLIYGIIPVLLCAVLFCAAAAVSGQIAGFTKPLPVKLYLIHLLFTLIPTATIYVLQHSLSMLIENQAVPLCVGALGEFMGCFQCSCRSSVRCAGTSRGAGMVRSSLSGSLVGRRRRDTPVRTSPSWAMTGCALR